MRCKSRCHSDVVCDNLLLIFGFDRRYVADGLEQSTMVEPVDPFDPGVLDGFEAASRPTRVDHLRFVDMCYANLTVSYGWVWRPDCGSWRCHLLIAASPTKLTDYSVERSSDALGASDLVSLRA